MARDYVKLFDRVKLYASLISKSNSFNVDIDASKLHQGDVLATDTADITLFDPLISQDDAFIRSNSTQSGRFAGLLSNYLQGDGKFLVQSSESSAALIAADIATFMDTDAQTVLSNIVGNTIAFDRAGDGVVSTLTQTQLTKADTIALTCTTAQNGGDAIFQVRSANEGIIGNVTADGVDSFTNVPTGIGALIVTAGTGGNEWALTDLITITTTSDDLSILLSVFRDNFAVLLPNTASSPTIDNNLVDVVTVFPVSPTDGQEVILDGVRYFFSEADDEFLESCI